MNRALNSKKLVRGAFESADLPRLPFIPWVFTHAARLEQMPVRRIFSDPTQYVKCLQNTQKLYGYDAIAGSFDSSLEAEICGCPITWQGDYEAPVAAPHPSGDFRQITDIAAEHISRAGRMGTVIESFHRINMVLGPTIAMVAVITGPLMLTAKLLGRNLIQDLAEDPEETQKATEATAGFLLKVIQGYCQMEPDIITIADRLMPILPPAHLSWLRSTLSPILNTIRFYNAFSILLPGEASPENLANLVELGFDGVVAAEIDLDTWNELKGGRSCILGKAVPSRLLTSGQKELQEYLELSLPTKIERGVFLTTDWEVPADTPPDNIHLFMNMLSK
jgi:uroporphyrinogen-III decarboxylase